MKMYLKYLWYVLRHKWLVFVECLRLGVPWRGVVHDLSKLRPDEFLPYARYFYGDYLSDAEALNLLKVGVVISSTKERIENAFDVAWNRHQKRNGHHWQYWILGYDDGGQRVLPMPDKCRREMLADWRGAGRALGKPDTKAWYLANRENIQLHPETRQWIETQLQVNDD